MRKFYHQLISGLFMLLVIVSGTSFAKTKAIDPTRTTVRVKVIFAGFSDLTPIPTNIDSILTSVTDFYDKMSLGQHHIISSVIRRPAPNQSYAYTAKHKEPFYFATTSQFAAKLGILQKDIFEQAYNDDTTTFKNVDFLFFIPLGNVFNGYTGYGALGSYTTAGLPSTIYSGPGITAQWLWNYAVNAYNLAHEYGHQLGLPHPPQNESYRYYGWYDLMYNSFADEPSTPLISAPQFLFNDLWFANGDTVQVSTNKRNVEITPFITTHKVYYYVDVNQNAFIIANYQQISYDTIYKGTGLFIWHTQGWNVWDIEAAHGNWLDGNVGITPWPAGLPLGSDRLDQKVTRYFTGADDFFDGRTYKHFSSGTNPNTDLYPADTSTSEPYYSMYGDTIRTRPHAGPSRFAILNIRRKNTLGADTAIMIADFFINNWSGHITHNTTWSDSIHISGDVVVDSGVTLTISRGTIVSFEPNFDDRNGGDFTGSSELIVRGTIIANGTTLWPVRFTSAGISPANGDWGGITVYSSGTATLGTLNSTYYYQYAARTITYKP